jgi:hypothetical protein
MASFPCRGSIACTKKKKKMYLRPIKGLTKMTKITKA